MKQKLGIAFSMAIILAMLLTTGAMAFTTTVLWPYNAPNKVVTISGGGSQMQNGQPPYADGQTVTVVVTGPHGPYNANNNPLGYTSTCTAIVGAADPNDPNAVATSGAWSCQVTLSENLGIALGPYTYIATSLAADGITPIHETGTFTDATTITTATIAIYDSWPCLTGKTDFIRTDSVVYCVNITGVSGGDLAGHFYIAWFSPSNFLFAYNEITVPPGNQLPASYTGSYYSSASSPTGAYTVKVCKNVSCSGTGNTVASAMFTLNAGMLNQTITITTPAPVTAVYNTSFTVTATASSGLPVTYSSGSPLICSNVGATFTMLVSAGTCVVQYDQVGNGTFYAAPQETSNTTAGKANQTITVDTSAAASAAYNTSFTVAAHSSSGLAVAYSSGSPFICSNVGALFTMLSGTGICVVQYDQAGDDNYNAATQVTENVTAQKANQAITVDTSAPATAVYNTSFTVAAHSSSGLMVVYSPSGVCTNVGATFTMTSGTGTCTVQYDQAGDDNYNPATQVTENITAQKANASCNVIGYNVVLDGASHTASGNCTGVMGENLTSLLNLDGTTHTNAGDYLADPWSFAGNSNYDSASGTVHDIIHDVTSGTCYGGPDHTILQPINSSGDSVFKQGSTVPAKFRVCDADGNSIGTAGVVVSFRIIATKSGTVVSTVDEAVDSTIPDTAFRWSASDQQWIFNINSKSLSKNVTYFYLITLNDGSTIPFQFGLK